MDDRARPTLGRRAYLASVLGIVLLSLASPLHAGPVEDLAAVSGISTPESESLDKEADKLIEDAGKAKADAEEARKAAAGKIDQKKLADALKRGDKSLLDTPEARRAQNLLQKSADLVKQAYQKADEAAVKRAHEAVEQRCIAPSTASSAPAVDSAASPYLCNAVRAGGAAMGQNDPWELCACARRYVSGLLKDYESLLARADGLVGENGYTGLGANDGTITQDNVDYEFRNQYRLVPVSIEALTTSFEQDASNIQKDIARGRIRQQLGGQGFAPSMDDTFLLSRSGAYAAVSPDVLWRLYLQEAGWRLSVLRFENEARHTARTKAFWNADAEAAAQYPDDMSGYLAQMEPLARQKDREDYGYIEETGQKLRDIMWPLQQKHRQLVLDQLSWQKYAAKDGESPRNEFPIDPVQPIRFEIIPSRDKPTPCCSWWTQFPNGLKQRYPELALERYYADEPKAVFIYSFERQPRKISALASGAATTEGP